MMKSKTLLFLSSLDITGERPSYDGVTKKVLLEIRTFQELGYRVDYVARLKDKVFLLNNAGKKTELTYNCSSFYKVMDRVYSALSRIYEAPDVIYIRYEGNSFRMRHFLSKMVRRNHNIKILAELPTYMGKWEPGSNLKSKTSFIVRRLMDVVCRLPLDYMVTFDNHKKLFGYKTIQIENFADVDALAIKQTKENKGKTFNILALAMMTPSHGFDRIIKGIKEYYSKGGTRKICLHLVGRGRVESDWLALAERLGIANSVVAHGIMQGQDLDDLVDYCHVGAGALAIFRKKCTKASELKIREYTARCLPFFYSADEPQIENEDFCLKIPNDESPVDIDGVLSFYDAVQVSGAYKRMRDFALKNFSCGSQMKTVLSKSACL